MTKEGWKKFILNINYDQKKIDLLAQHLSGIDECKKLLSDFGYSYTGLSLLKSIKELISERRLK